MSEIQMETEVLEQLARRYVEEQRRLKQAQASVDRLKKELREAVGVGNSVEAGLMEMLTRMEQGKFKVFNTLYDWFEEFRLYHRKDGKLVKLKDDLMSATRYAAMSLRYAEVEKSNWNKKGHMGPDVAIV